jgi:hypothetical protein
MKTRLLVALALFTATFAFSQDDENTGFFGSDFTVHDRFGREYTLPEVMLPPNRTQAMTCIAGTSPGPVFELTFQDVVNSTGVGFDDHSPGTFMSEIGLERQAVACQVFTDISAALVAAGDPYTVSSSNNPTQYVRIFLLQSTTWSGSPPEDPSVLGYASPYFLEAVAGVNSLTSGTAWQMINSGFDPWYGITGSNLVPPPSPACHAFIKMNFLNYGFYNDLSNPISPSSSDHDLYSVLLHEATHGLGFLSLINSNGASKLWSNHFNGPYTMYDSYLKSVSGSNPLIQSSGTSQYNTNWTWNCNTSLVPLYTGNSCGITFNGISNTCGPDYTPGTWSSGSSLSHFDMGCNSVCSSSATYVMHPALPTGVMRRTYALEEIKTLCDLHYETTGLFGGTYPLSSATYGSAGTCGFRVAGVNDFRPYAADNNNTSQNFTTLTTTPITLNYNDFLANDENADTYTNLTVIRGYGNVTPLSATSFTFQAANNYFGNVTLSYVPVNNNGQHGQATYVFITVSPPVLTGCPLNSSSCKLICNEGFENSYGYGDFSPIINPTVHGRIAGWQELGTSDLYVRNCPDPTAGIPNNGLGTGLEVWDFPNPNNNHYVQINTYYLNLSEGIQQLLTSPLVPGTNYTLQLHVMNKPAPMGPVVPYDFLVYAANSLTTSASSGNGQLLLDQMVPADNTWHTYTLTFSPSSISSYLTIRTQFNTQANTQRGFLLDDITLFQTPIPVNAGPDLHICGTASNIQLAANACTDANLTYTWMPGNLSTSAITVSPTVTTTYTVTVNNVTADYSYTGSDQVTIFVNPNPTVTASTGTPNICWGDNATLTASGASTYVWAPASTLSSSTGASVVATPTVTTTYTVTGTSSAGCTGTATVTVTVTPACTATTTINTPTTWTTGFSGQNMAINADITINGNVVISASTLTILKNKKITVLPGSVLTISASHLLACTNGPCTGLWYGIYVFTGGTLNLNNNTLIEDAQNAVITEAVTGTITGIPSLNISQVMFNKNAASIVISQHPNNMSANVIQANLFTCRTLPSNITYTNLKTDIIAETNAYGAFTTTLAGVRSVKGISIDNANINVGVPTAGLMNYFENMDYGIYLKQANTVIKNNTFIRLQGLSALGIPYGVGVYAPTQSLPTIPNAVTIGANTTNHRNTFTDVYRGIDIRNQWDVNANGNVFNTNGIVVTGFSQQGDYAINLADISRSVVAVSNTITNYVTGIKLARNTVTATLNPAITFNLNSITNNQANTLPQNGIILIDVVNNILAPQSSTISQNSITKCNSVCIKVSNIKNPLTIDANPSLSVNYAASGNQYGIWLEFCNQITVTGNVDIRSTFTGTYTSAQNLNIRGIYVNQSINSLIRCNQVFQAGIGIEFNGTCTSPTSSGYGVYSNSFATLRNGFRLTSAVIGTQGANGVPRSNIWNAPAANYPDGQTYTSSSNSVSSTVYGTSSLLPTNNLGTGTPYALNVSLFSTTGTMFSCPCPTCRVIPEAPQSQTEQEELEKMITDSTRFPAYNEEMHWSARHYAYCMMQNGRSFRSPLLEGFSTMESGTSLGKLWQVDALTASGRYEEALALNQSISPVNFIEKNQCSFNAIYLKKLADSQYEYTPGDLATLTQLANQCSMTGGNAVVQARNLLSVIENKELLFTEPCTSTPGEKTKADLQNGFQLYPNPNDGNMTLEYSISKNAELVITDLTGKPVCTYLLDKNSRQTPIACEGLSGGIYLYRVMVDGEVVNSGKIGIVK